MPTDPPIACTLQAGDFRDRLQWIAELNARALRDVRREALTLRLAYAPEALADVRELVRRERACCAFLAFELDEGADAVRLAISAPEAAREGLEAVFAPFVAGRATGPACGCASR